MTALVNLADLQLENNPLEEPPASVIADGTAAILRYFEQHNFAVVSAAEGVTVIDNRGTQRRQLSVTVLSASLSSAPAADFFVELTVDARSFERTAVCKRSANPMWYNQRFTL